MNRRAKIRQLSLLVSILLGIGTLGFLVVLTDFTARDFQTYYYAATNVLSGAQFIGTTPQMPTGPYVYLPITVIFYLPFALLPKWTVAYPLLIAINVLGGTVLAILLARTLQDRGRSLSRLDMGLLIGLFTFSPVAVLNIAQTQPNLWLAVCVLLGFRCAEKQQNEAAGVLFAIPAMFKLWPAFFGVWLAYQRNWRAIGAAVLTGLSALLASVLVFGVRLNQRYFNHILTERRWADRFAGGIDPDKAIVTVRRPISVLLPSVDPTLMALLGFAVTGGILAGVYWLANQSETDPIVTFGVTLTLVTVAFPSVTAYLVFLLIPATALLYKATTKRVVVALTISIVLLAMPFTPRQIVSLLDLLPLPAPLGGVLSQVTFNTLQFGLLPLWGAFVLVCCLALRAMKSSKTARRMGWPANQ